MSFLIDSSRRILHSKSRAALASITSTSSTYRKAETPEEEPQIPHSHLFESLGSDFKKSPHDLEIPTPAECATHLELLEVFYVLRQRIIKSESLDKVFDTEAQHQEVTLRDGTTKKLRDKDFWERREVKWAKYLQHATARFIVWRRKVTHTPIDIDSSYASLPPVDVLMVWHAFLLNPRLFKTTSQELALYKLDFPWRQIHNAIDNSDWKFTLPEQSSNHFKAATGLAGDLFEQLSTFASDNAPCELSSLRALDFQNTADIPQGILALDNSNSIRRHFEIFHSANKEFANQLRDAVVRQTSFVDKMNAHLWIRSPAVEGTITRAMRRYRRFLQLYKLYPNTMFVPTLDIDLVWHTHQCSASVYFNSTRSIAGKFVNHDDSIVQDRLDTGFETTRNLYRIRFIEEYPICGCWDCEALLSELERPTHTKDGSPDLEAMVKKVIDDVTYYRHVEVLRRGKQPLPVRQGI